MEQGIELHAAAKPQGAHALGTVHLVGRYGRHVARSQRHRHPPEPLDRVAEEQGAMAAGDRGELFDRLDHPDLVIDQHRRDQAGPAADPRGGEIEVDQAVAPDRQYLDLEALPALPFDAVEYASMLASQGDDPAAPRCKPRRGAL